MRHSLIIPLLVVAACSKAETPATDSPAPAPAPVAAAPVELNDSIVGGTWDAQLMPIARDTVILTFTMNNTDTGAGTSIVFPSGLKVANKSRQISGDSVVSETGPFKSQVRRGQNVTSTRAVLRMQDGKLAGVLSAKYANGDTTSYRITATKKP